MIETTLTIDGMMCGMCESHVNDAVRNKFKVKKVTSSHSKGQTVIISDQKLDESQLRAAIEETGYKVLAVTTKEAGKKGFLGLFGKK